MKRKIITITDEGAIVAPQNPNSVRMTIGEIAALLGVYYPTAKRHIRAIEKAGIADGDYSMTCVSEGTTAFPMFYGLEMIVTVAFRVKSWQADTFRLLADGAGDATATPAHLGDRSSERKNGT